MTTTPSTSILDNIPPEYHAAFSKALIENGFDFCIGVNIIDIPYRDRSIVLIFKLGFVIGLDVARK